MGKLLMKFVGITLTLNPALVALLISSSDNAPDIRVEWYPSRNGILGKRQDNYACNNE